MYYTEIWFCNLYHDQLLHIYTYISLYIDVPVLSTVNQTVYPKSNDIIRSNAIQPALLRCYNKRWPEPKPIQKCNQGISKEEGQCEALPNTSDMQKRKTKKERKEERKAKIIGRLETSTGCD